MVPLNLDGRIVSLVETDRPGWVIVTIKMRGYCREKETAFSDSVESVITITVPSYVLDNHAIGSRLEMVLQDETK